jgi:hypothetical protein
VDVSARGGTVVGLGVVIGLTSGGWLEKLAFVVGAGVATLTAVAADADDPASELQATTAIIETASSATASERRARRGTLSDMPVRGCARAANLANRDRSRLVR